MVPLVRASTVVHDVILLQAGEADGVVCSDGYRCDPDQTIRGGCAEIHCAEPDGLVCGDFERCNPEPGLGSSCEKIHCSEPDGPECAEYQVCESEVSGAGCRYLGCDEGGPACGAAEVCTPRDPLGFGGKCQECLVNEDCGCGSCIMGLCYKRPGYVVGTCG